MPERSDGVNGFIPSLLSGTFYLLQALMFIMNLQSSQQEIGLGGESIEYKRIAVEKKKAGNKGFHYGWFHYGFDFYSVYIDHRFYIWQSTGTDNQCRI